MRFHLEKIEGIFLIVEFTSNILIIHVENITEYFLT